MGSPETHQKSPQGGPGSSLVRKPTNVRFCHYLQHLRHVGQPKREPKSIRNRSKTVSQNIHSKKHNKIYIKGPKCLNSVKIGCRQDPKRHPKSTKNRHKRDVGRDLMVTVAPRSSKGHPKGDFGWIWERFGHSLGCFLNAFAPGPLNRNL